MVFGDIIEIWNSYSLTERTLEHLSMFFTAIFFAILIGILLGMFLFKNERFAFSTLNFLNILETFPDIALLILLLPLVGIGEIPTIIACVIYSVLPVSRNVYTGLKHVDSAFLEIARAIGFKDNEILYKIRLPLAMPMIAGGIRIAIVFTMGIVTLGGIFGAGGLGAPLQTGINLIRPDIIYVAGIWVGILAVILDGFAGFIEKYLTRRYGTWQS
ncbi:ABC transporter permease [Methanoplanus sp. FWC-SCC4]|uniref:ABC transporter permease n=1 Tax=Methanochimaera problematica TaxID=2609417 RepID=A0AA97I489_9EURY|nr:ABC transporter permease [Methanoplanus sp. FWC-SCC4]WOF16259.1 ABC transporter permease [Methanoplanus sp. FWC-SCC4]